MEPGLNISPERTSCSLLTRALLYPAALRDTVMAVCGAGVKYVYVGGGGKKMAVRKGIWL